MTYRTRKAMRAVHPSGPPAYYLVGDKGEPLDQDPMVFCCEECRRQWIVIHGKPGSRQARNWQFVKGKPLCDQCGSLLFERVRNR